MNNEEIAVTFKAHEKEIGSLKHRMDDCEEQNKTLNQMALSVNRLATNMEHMLDEQKAQGEEQKAQGERLRKLEQQPAKDFQHYKQLIIGAFITLIVGFLFGQFF